MKHHLLTTSSPVFALPRRRLFRSLHPSSQSVVSQPRARQPLSNISSLPSLATPNTQKLHALSTLPQTSPHTPLPQVWFNPSFPSNLGGQPDGDKPPDERTIKLGKTLRILQERLPTLLQSPLPSEILAPTISLHLFPSTHPHLPVVSGRVAYIAALWTSPLAWNRVPLVGNVKLEILSERMTRHPPLANTVPGYQPRPGAGDEQLVVRWRTVGGGAISAFFKSLSPPNGNAAKECESRRHVVGTGQAVDDPKEFTGLFIFEFDGKGRVLSHTIENVAEGSEWERSVGARFVGLTDWLLGGIKGSGSSSGETPMPAFMKLRHPHKVRS